MITSSLLLQFETRQSHKNVYYLLIYYFDNTLLEVLYIIFITQHKLIII